MTVDLDSVHAGDVGFCLPHCARFIGSVPGWDRK